MCLIHFTLQLFHIMAPMCQSLCSARLLLSDTAAAVLPIRGRGELEKSHNCVSLDFSLGNSLEVTVPG